MVKYCKIYVELILGHRATVRDEKTPEGYTHDWEVYVKSDQGNLQAFVDRVIFHLHETFPKPKRVVKEPPFVLKASGYAGFNLFIEIQFKTKDSEIRNAKFPYDLFLQSAGPPISASRKEKLTFNYPSDEFAKKLVKGGGYTILADKDKEKSHEKHGSSTEKPHSSASITNSSSSQSQSNNQHMLSGGGKSSKHTLQQNLSNQQAASAPAKPAPKNSFETLFGTPIKKSAGSLQPMLPSSATGGSSTGSGKGPKSAKSEKIFGENVKYGGGKDNLAKHEKVKHDKSDKHAKSSKSPAKDTSSDFKSKSRSKSAEKKDKITNTKKMLPPANTSVPKKAIKSEIFESSPSPNNTTTSGNTSGVVKSEKKSRKSTSKTRSKSPRDDAKDKVDAIMKKVKTVTKQPLSPISSTSSSSSSSSSANSANSDNDDESESDLLQEKQTLRANLPSTPSPTPISSSTSITSRKRTRKSESQSPMSNVTSPASSSSSAASSAQVVSSAVVPSKRRKDSSSSSALTPETPPKSKRPGSSNSNEVTNSSSVTSPSKSRREKKNKRSHSSKDKSKSSKKKRESNKEKRRSLSPKGRHSSKSKKKKKKSKKSGNMFEDSSEYVSGSSSAASGSEAIPEPSSPRSTNANGESNQAVTSNSSFSHSAVAGNITAEMKLLKDLHTKISTIEDPNKLQEIVDIVEGCGREMWTVDSGVTFDFDLCKLNSTAIKRLQQAILI